MSRHIWICLPVLAAAALACKSPEAPATKGRSEPANSAAEPQSPPKATDPDSVETLPLDASTSRFEFDAAKITETHHGAFKQFSGAATTIGDSLHTIAVEVDTASIEADDPQLTAHLKTADFLDVEKFPKATFKSSSVLQKPAGTATHEITGQLTLHGVTQEISFPATIETTPTAVRASAELRINRQKFGVTYPGLPDDLIKDEVVLRPSFAFVQK